MVKTIAVTGGIGSGQTTVCSIFQKFGCKIINADLVGKQIVDTNSNVIQELKDEFGKEFFDKKNQLDRKKFAEHVFEDKNKIKRLNEIVHPVLISELILEMETAEQSKKYKVIIIDAALIYELAMERFFDFVVVVTAPYQHRLDRVMKRDGVSRKRVLDRMKNQFPLPEKVQWADYVVKNTQDIENLESQVFDIYEELLKK